jgi:hypothetical protein
LWSRSPASLSALSAIVWNISSYAVSDVTGWEPIADQAAARTVPLQKVRQAEPGIVVLGTVKAPRHPAAPTGRRARKPVVVWVVDGGAPKPTRPIAHEKPRYRG